MRYRRADAAGGTYFFTVNLAERRSDLLVRHIDDLRATMKTVKDAHSFDILVMVVLSEHLHTIWRLPPERCRLSTTLVAHQGRVLAATGKRRAHSSQPPSEA